MLHSFEPANAGGGPLRSFRLGSSLSRTLSDTEPHFKGVGSKPVVQQSRTPQGNYFIPQVNLNDQINKLSYQTLCVNKLCNKLVLRQELNTTINLDIKLTFNEYIFILLISQEVLRDAAKIKFYN